MAGYWDSVDESGPTTSDDLKSYLEERKRKAARYLRTAKQAQKRIEQLQEIAEKHRKALGQES
ncbi:hypothetical protein [Nisaea sp.]|uniref:hypothetical protein n=1 Tax=Nisaea sp. TaxID=2024842 RepID=UPI003B52A4D6